MQIRLIDEWHKFHHFATIRVGAVFISILGIGPSLLNTWATIPDDLKAALPQGTARFVAIAGFVLMMLARVIHFGTEDHGHDAQ